MALTPAQVQQKSYWGNADGAILGPSNSWAYGDTLPPGCYMRNDGYLVPPADINLSNPQYQFAAMPAGSSLQQSTEVDGGSFVDHWFSPGGDIIDVPRLQSDGAFQQGGLPLLNASRASIGLGPSPVVLTSYGKAIPVEGADATIASAVRAASAMGGNLPAQQSPVTGKTIDVPAPKVVSSAPTVSMLQEIAATDPFAGAPNATDRGGNFSSFGPAPDLAPSTSSATATLPKPGGSGFADFFSSTAKEIIVGAGVTVAIAFLTRKSRRRR